MGNEEKSRKSTMYKRAIISTAVIRLSTQNKLSPEQAREWILQEAMAKKVNLDEVAEAVLNNETVAYRYSAPI
jgi:AmiR/NasT family two-component response regulator